MFMAILYASSILVFIWKLWNARMRIELALQNLSWVETAHLCFVTKRTYQNYRSIRVDIVFRFCFFFFFIYSVPFAYCLIRFTQKIIIYFTTFIDPHDWKVTFCLSLAHSQMKWANKTKMICKYSQNEAHVSF